MALAINCDMGESFGLYRMGDDAAIMPLIIVANVACGFHASDSDHMRTTVRLAKQHGVKVGAHPSLPDLQGFGRREMKMEPRGAGQLHHLPGRRAEGLPRRRGHDAQPHQAARRALRHGGAHGGCRARHLRRGGRLQGAAARHDRHAAREGLHQARPRLRRRVLCRPRLRRRRQPDHHPRARRRRIRRGGRSARVRAITRGQDQVGRRQGHRRARRLRSACIPTRPNAVEVAEARAPRRSAAP